MWDMGVCFATNNPFLIPPTPILALRAANLTREDIRTQP